MNDLPRNNDGTLTAYAWPGGYPVMYLDTDGSILCAACATTSLDDAIERFRPTAFFVHMEGPPEYCAQCSAQIESARSAQIESAYGDPDEDEDGAGR